ncbi:surface carbohydrate biosynthesis protein [Gracilibacillus orientalis]|uniref:Surface carbohydrate biosynthesis protein n=1 Tax=Gracilibacillus orientalis TaxID=334253 RepID=A0A1I4MUR3_9BACI|nr:surface carbohydrate biosynthesis protein [Gracilibacillus orientalis]SFM06800.1 surface carbohydrate biosynthesis protein [Gracilibacillus orientalis]
MTNRWLYLPIEVKVRELDAKLLLSYYAIQQGYQVIIGDQPNVTETLAQYPQGIYFAKGGPKGFRKRMITSAVDNGQTVVELDEEGLLIEKKRYIRDRMRKDTLQFVEHEYCWGEHQKQVISNTYPDMAYKCHVVGNPRFDLLQPKYRSLYQKEVKSLQEQYGEFILINTRFSIYNAAKGKKDTVFVQHIKELYESFLKMIEKTARRFSHLTIIIRPHPAENFNSYRQAFRDLSNVHVVHEGVINKWLLAAKMVIHNGCTSGIEAFLLDKPVIAYIPFETEDTELPNLLGFKATTITELHQTIDQLLHHKAIIPDDDRLYHYCRWDIGDYSFQHILGLCNTITLPSPPLSLSKSRKKPIKNVRKQKRKFSLLEEEITSFYQILDEIEQQTFKRTIQQIAPQVFYIKAG